MTQNDKSFWPKDLLENLPSAPVDLIQQQAGYLSELTNGHVIGEVKVSAFPEDSDGDTIGILFYISAPSIKYRYELVQFFHGLALYPVKVFSSAQHVESLANESQLRLFLKNKLSQPMTGDIIKALYIQSKQNQSKSTQNSSEDIPF